jgi:signal transduction histidine kinase
MVDTQRGRRDSLLENYCSQLGSLLQRPYPGLALVAAKQQAETAAELANEAMVQAKRGAALVKTKFLASMAHELRTPLNPILGFSEIIKLDGLQAKESYPKYAEYIHDAGMLLLDIINGLVDLAEIEAREVELEEQLVAVGDVVQSAIAAIRPIAQEKSIDINCEFGQEATLPICVDPTKFKQIMINLLSNGVRFTEPEGQILLGSSLDSRGSLVISIADTGIGIAPEHLQKVLEPFAQVQDRFTGKSEGIGLGLPIARALIELHGGELVLSSALGIGTTVALRLPGERVRHAAFAISG